MIGRTNVSGDYGVGDSIFIENLKGNNDKNYFYDITDTIALDIANVDGRAISRNLINFINDNDIFFYSPDSSRYFYRYSFNESTQKYEEVYKTLPFGYSPARPVYAFDKSKNITVAYSAERYSASNNKLVIVNLDNGNAIVSKSINLGEDYENIWIEISDRYIYVNYPHDDTIPDDSDYVTNVYDFNLNLVKQFTRSSFTKNVLSKVLSFPNYEVLINGYFTRIIDYSNWTIQNNLNMSFAYYGATDGATVTRIYRDSDCFNIDDNYIYFGGGSTSGQGIAGEISKSFLFKFIGTSLNKVSESAFTLTGSKPVLSYENGKPVIYEGGFTYYGASSKRLYALTKYIIENDSMNLIYRKNQYDFIDNNNLPAITNNTNYIDNNNMLKFWGVAPSGYIAIGNVYNANLINN